MAVSLFVNLKGAAFADLDSEILEEWQALHNNGIVPQKPIKP